MTKPLPAPAVKRLSLYLHQLEKLSEKGIALVSSQELARSLQLTSAQVRRDLATFGQFGKRGVGYKVNLLTQSLHEIMGTDKTWNVILVGVGDLGRALARYRGFRERGFVMVAAFDIKPEKIGKKVGTLEIRHIREMPDYVKNEKVRLALLTTSANASQEVLDQLARAGIRGVLSFAPGILQKSVGVAIGQVDIAANLEQLAFSIASEDS